MGTPQCLKRMDIKEWTQSESLMSHRERKTEF